MKYHQIQLMVHGDNMSRLTPQLKYPGVAITDVTRVDNANYLFVTLDISATAKPGTLTLNFFSDGSSVVSHSFELLAREKRSAQRQGFSSKDAIYLITPDRFANGDPRNDNHPSMLEKANRTLPGGRHGGDIAGMGAHLDYIAAMGFTQIWPNPLTENNQPEYSYHGYAATDLYSVDPRFGSNADFKQFVARARRKGLGVIQDIILNHIGSGHWWLNDMPTPDWLNTSAAYRETNHRRTTLQDPYAAPEDREDFVRGWFSPAMPDLNQRNPLLANYLIQNTLWWIEFAGLSGVREDTYGYADEKFLSRWARTIMEEYPHFNMVGEEWSANPAIVSHWQKGKNNPDGHVPFMPSMIDFPLEESLRTALLEDEKWDTGLIRLYEQLANDFLYPDPFNLVIFGENHDTSRLYSYLHEDISLYKMALVYLATMRGIPQFYYGSEILMTSPRERDDGAVRADMPGGWKGDNKNAFSGKGLTAKERDAQLFIKRLLNWRKHSEVIHKGKLQHFAPREGVYVYVRWNNDKTVMVVLNKNKHEKRLSLERFAAFLQHKTRARDPLNNLELPLDADWNLPPRSAWIVEIE